MSKTTFFKRIAMTAIAALGFGMLSVAPSNATVTSHTLTIDNAADAIEVGETATAVLTHNFVNLGNLYDSVTVQAVVTSANAQAAGTIKMNITDSFTSIADDGSEANSPRYFVPPLDHRNDGSFETRTVIRGIHAGTSGIGTGALSSTLQSAGTAVDSFTVGYTGSANRNIGTQVTLRLVAPTNPGTFTVSVFTLASAGGATATSATPSVTWTVTVTAAATTAATSASSVTLRNGNVSAAIGTYLGGTAEGTDSQTLASRVTSTTSTTPSFQLYVKQKDGTAANTAKESYTVQVTGEAFVTKATVTDAGSTLGAYSDSTSARPTYSGTNGVTGSKYLRMATPVADSPTVVNVWSTGTAGTATITVTTDGGVVIGTKTLTFHGPATALAVTTTTRKVLQAGSATAISAVLSVTATDALGYKVTGVSPAIVSSNLSAVSTGSCTDAVGAVTDGVYSCSVNPVVTSTSGMAATLTIRIPDPAVTTATAAAGPFLSTTYGVTMGGAVSTLVLTTDKATYDPGTAMVVTATAKDSSGNTPYDGQDGPTLRANKQLGGTAAGTTITMNAYYDGVSTSQTRSSVVRTMSAATTLFAPAATGAFTISGLDAQTTPVEVSVTATVNDDGATAAAKAAGVAATAAAEAAADAAAEAIDAANAATDAANLAAEAADAATVAAEEARDAADAATAAVEALATEVATLMAALKAQITTLANTVAKIAKKVKA